MKAVRPRFRICPPIAVVLGFLGSAGTSFPQGISAENTIPTNSQVQPIMAPADLATIAGTASALGSDGVVADAAIARAAAGDFLVLHAEFQNAEACRKFAVPGAYVFHRFECFADIFLAKRDVFKEVSKVPGIRWLELGTTATAPPARKGEGDVGKNRGIDPIASAGVRGLTGKGVIIAIVDSGIDFRNPDFIRFGADGKPTSRLLYFWDTLTVTYGGQPSRRAPASYPNGTSIGTLYSQEDLTRELQSARPQIPVWDTNGHGTACAGIAAGNGNNSAGRYAGVAPDADIIAVRLGAGPRLENTYLLNTVCDWLHEVAGKKPLVISCSFGGQQGGRDGSRLSERQLDARYTSQIKGRALCVAAGNEGSEAIHAQVKYGSDQAKGVLKWNATGPATITIYLPGASLGDLRFEKIDEKTARNGAFIHALSGTLVVPIAAPAGPGEVVLFSSSGKAQVADAYLSSEGKAGFDPSCVSFSKQVGSPGTASQAITVGSYDWNDQFSQFGKDYLMYAPNRQGKLGPLTIGALSTYSNAGPSRAGGSVKPDIVAPGQYFTVPAVLNAGEGNRESSGKYRLFNGTSAATPYTAGVIALLMQKKPDLTLGEIKDLLKKHATVDEFTGKVPNPGWGNGKLDLKAVERMLEAVP